MILNVQYHPQPRLLFLRSNICIIPLRIFNHYYQYHHHFHHHRNRVPVVVSLSPRSRWFSVVTVVATKEAEEEKEEGKSLFQLPPAIDKRFHALKRRHDELFEQLKSTPSPQLGKELSQLSSIHTLYQKRTQLQDEIQSMHELIRENNTHHESDPDWTRECQQELTALTRQLQKVQRKVVDAVLPSSVSSFSSSDHTDSNNENSDAADNVHSDAVIEVRAGTGGDEASLFCAELLDSYVKTATALRWKAEMLTRSATDIGGVREAALSVSALGKQSLYYRIRMHSDDDDDEEEDDDENDDGDASSSNNRLVGPYGFFQFESGVHRVQRVPINDSKIHTSACSVAVLPLDSRSNVQVAMLPPAELKIETMRASGAGGQHVNTTDSAVRITHLPTGLTASIQDERTQHQNKDKALKLITARVNDQRKAERDRIRGDTQRTLMGSGDRSERIRTYNFPQDRVTDHRTKTTKYGIELLLAGGPIDGLAASFLPDLKELQRAELIQKLESESETTQ